MTRRTKLLSKSRRYSDNDDDDDDDEEEEEVEEVEEASGQLLCSRQDLPLLFLELHSQNCRGPSRAKTKIPSI